MDLVSGRRHPYRDEGAILTNMAPSSLGDGGFIQLKGQRDACKKVGGMDFVSTQNAAGVPYFNVSSMNLEQSKLTVNGTFNCNGGFLWEKSNMQPRQPMYKPRNSRRFCASNAPPEQCSSTHH